jgi:3-oxoacyl-[acyl-carrier protein] reductase
MNALEGKCAIVTGAGRGVGRATALRLSRAGARVVVNDLDPEPAAAVAGEITAAGGAALTFPGDVTEADFGDRLVASALAEFGDLHIVVNNAGYIWNTSALNHTDEQFQAMLDVHATAPFRILRAAGRHFRDAAKRAGAANPCRKVVNVSSISGHYGAALQLGYAAGKAALIGVTRALAKEWGRYNVTVNCVALGHIDTRLTQRLDDGPATIDVAGRDYKVGLDPDTHDLIRQLTPLGRTGVPDDAAGAIYLLCLPESDFVSGQVLVASGGLVM